MKILARFLLVSILSISSTYAQPYILERSIRDCYKAYLTQSIAVPPSLAGLPWDIALDIVVLDTLCKSINEAAADSALSAISLDSLLLVGNAIIRVTEYDPILGKLLLRLSNEAYSAKYKMRYDQLCNQYAKVSKRRLGDYTGGQKQYLLNDGIYFGKILSLDTLMFPNTWYKEPSPGDTSAIVCAEILVNSVVKGDALVERKSVGGEEYIETVKASWMISTRPVGRDEYDHSHLKPGYGDIANVNDEAVFTICAYERYDSVGKYYVNTIQYVNQVQSGHVSNADNLFGLQDGLSVSQFLEGLATLKNAIIAGEK